MEGLLESAAAPLESVRPALGDTEFEEAVRKGRALSLAQVMELARVATALA